MHDFDFDEDLMFSVMGLSIYNDCSGDPPSYVTVFQCTDGGYVLAADDVGDGTVNTSTFLAGTPADDLLGALQDTGIAEQFNLRAIASELVVTGENRYVRGPTGGDDWTDQLDIEFWIGYPLLDELT